MDFNLTEEQIAFRDVVRRWVDAELPKDLMRKLEADEQNYPFEIWEKLKAEGFFGVGIPEEYGGLGGDVVMQMIFAREMSRTAGGLLWVWGLTSFGGAHSIAIAGNEEQKQRWLPEMAAGNLRVQLLTRGMKGAAAQRPVLPASGQVAACERPTEPGQGEAGDVPPDAIDVVEHLRDERAPGLGQVNENKAIRERSGHSVSNAP